MTALDTRPEESHGQPQRLLLNLAPNSVLFLERDTSEPGASEAANSEPVAPDPVQP